MRLAIGVHLYRNDALARVQRPALLRPTDVGLKRSLRKKRQATPQRSMAISISLVQTSPPKSRSLSSHTSKPRACRSPCRRLARPLPSRWAYEMKMRGCTGLDTSRKNHYALRRDWLAAKSSREISGCRTSMLIANGFSPRLTGLRDEKPRALPNGGLRP